MNGERITFPSRVQQAALSYYHRGVKVVSISYKVLQVTPTMSKHGILTVALRMQCGCMVDAYVARMMAELCNKCNINMNTMP